MDAQSLVKEAGQHYFALGHYLESHLANESGPGISVQRQSAREKLTKLNGVQFHELSTDVYDEMNRRIKNSDDDPFLSVQSQFHPKRNQARQKLATLSQNRFKDLASDVYHELSRRYGEKIDTEKAPSNDSLATKHNYNALVEEKPLPMAFPMAAAAGKAAPQAQSVPEMAPNTAVSSSSKPKSAGTGKDVQALVNFTSLDNLMEDLGNMLNNGGAESGSSPTAAQAEQHTAINSSSATPSPAPAVATAQQPQSESDATRAVQPPTSPLRSSSKKDSNSTSRSATPVIVAPQRTVASAKQSSSAIGELDSGAKEEEFSRAKDEVQRLTDQLKQKKAENERIGEQLRLRQVQVDKIQFENQELAKKLINTEGLMNSLKMEAARLRSEEDKYRTERQFHEERTQELNARITQLEMDLRATESLKKELNDSRALLEAAQSEKDEVMELMKTLEVEAMRLKDELQMEKRITHETKFQLDQLAKELESTKMKKIQAEQSLTEKDDKIRLLEATVDQMKEQSQQQQQPSAHEQPSKIIEPPTRNSSFNLMQKSQSRQQPSGSQNETSSSQSANLSKQPTIDNSPVSAIPSKLDLTDESLYEGNGQMDLEQLQSFKSSIEELLKCSRIDNPANVLIAMKSVVACTRAISDCLARAQTIEANSPAVALIRKLIADNLTALINASKTHATTAKPLDSSGIDTATDNLIVHIVAAVHLLKIGAGPQEQNVNSNSAATATATASAGQEQAAYDQAVVDLKGILEQQTDLIVQNIQVLLQAMRQSAFGRDFNETILGITSVVGNLVSASRDTLIKPQTSAPTRQRGEQILFQLEESNKRLGDMGESMIQGQQKPSKQKLASAAYEVAKFTKELVSLFDVN